MFSRKTNKILICRGNVFHFTFIAVAIKRILLLTCDQSSPSLIFRKKTFDIITCTVKITTNDLALRQRDTPIERHRGKLQNSFDIWIGKIMTKFISRYHCTSHQFSKTVPTVHNFSIWFLTVKSGLFFFQDYKIGK